MSDALKQIEEYRRGLLVELLSRCLPRQQELFGKLYPEGVKKIPEAKLNWAIQQCENTLRINKKLGRVA